MKNFPNLYRNNIFMFLQQRENNYMRSSWTDLTQAFCLYNRFKLAASLIKIMSYSDQTEVNTTHFIQYLRMKERKLWSFLKT